MNIIAGLVLGFIGSLHCVGMCGPIVITAFNGSEKRYFTNRILYNLGRTFTYAIFGLSMGLIGEVVQLTGYQQTTSIVMGSIILLFAILYFLGIKRDYPSFNKLIVWTKHKLGKFLRKRGLVNDFSLGVINGFLPCGMVYLALAGALTMSNVAESTLYMIFFGLGTIPAMLAISYLAPVFGRRININRLIPIMFSILGLLLIVRGLGLGIPYLSPEIIMGSGHMH